jgi:D-psicose/D-tagatose/L-ribulose 3-epimerase
MNRVGIYFAYWTRDWGADYGYYIDKAAALGFDILEICTASLLDMPNSGLEELRARAEGKGIELTYCVGFPPEYDVASADESVRRAGVAYAKDTLKAIHALGGRVFGGINYSCWPATLNEGITDKRPWLDRSVRSMKEIAKAAEDCGVDYCVEVVNRFEQFLINTAEEAAAFVEEIGSPRVKILLDTFHMNIEEDSIYDAVVTAGTALGHLHIGETNRRTPGLGRIPWGELMAALRKIGYRGRIVMEPFVKMGGPVGRDIKMWRDLSGGADEAAMDKAAAAACAFIRGQQKLAAGEKGWSKL